ncbi:CC153 protein, partial [Fregetta grallaria]|nr:CC153 protein [Fregetta grallaria]
RDMARQTKADNEVLKQRLWDLEKALEQAWEDKRVICEEMTQQYQELRKQTAAHSQRLEAKVKSLQEQLRMAPRHTCPSPSQQTQALAERNRTITQLQGRLDAIEREYAKILHVSGNVAVGGSPGSMVLPPHGPLSHQSSMDLVLAKMAEASQHWEEVGTTIAVEHKERLQEFSLNPLEI